MSTDSVKGFIELASTMTGLSVEKAREVTRSFLTAALDAVDNPSAAVTHLSDVMRSGSARAAETVGESVAQAATGLTDTVRDEIERAAARLGFVREEELAALRARVQRLEAQLAAVDLTAPAAKAAATPRTKPARGTAKKPATTTRKQSA